MQQVGCGSLAAEQQRWGKKALPIAEAAVMQLVRQLAPALMGGFG